MASHSVLAPCWLVVCCFFFLLPQPHRQTECPLFWLAVSVFQVQASIWRVIYLLSLWNIYLFVLPPLFCHLFRFVHIGCCCYHVGLCLCGSGKGDAQVPTCRACVQLTHCLLFLLPCIVSQYLSCCAAYQFSVQTVIPLLKLSLSVISSDAFSLWTVDLPCLFYKF